MPETHFALTIEPAGDAAPGDTIRLCYRARNTTATAAPAGLVRFVLPSEAAPADGAAAEIALESLPAGAERILTLPVTLASPLENGTALAFQAALCLGEAAPLGSNRARLSLRSRARLGGPRTCAALAVTDDADRVRVAVTVANDGNASARGLHVIVPAPCGTVGCDGTSSARFALDALDAGDAATFCYDVLITAPPRPSLRATGAYVEDETGPVVAIPPGEPLALRAVLDDLHVAMDVHGRRTAVTVRCSNGGWASIAGATLAISWPAGFRLAEGSLLYDGAPVAGVKTRGALATVVSRSGGCELGLARVAPRSAPAVTFDLYAVTGAAAGVLTVDVRAAETRLQAARELLPPPAGTLRLRLLAAPDDALEPGALARILVELAHTGDGVRSVALAVSGPATALTVDGKRHDVETPLVLGPGVARTLGVAIAIPVQAGDGDAFDVEIHAVDESAAATLRVPLRARERAWLEADDWLETAGGTSRIRLRNAGETLARDVVVTLAGSGERIVIGDIAPGSFGEAAIGEHLAAAAARGATATTASGRTVHLKPSLRAVPLATDLEAALRVPEALIAGRTAELRLLIVSSRAIEMLSVRCVESERAAVVPGSTTLNGHPIVDVGDGSVLHGRGVTIHDVPAQTPVEVVWRVVPDPVLAEDTELTFAADVVADGLQRSLVAGAVRVSAQRAYAPRPETLPFHVDAIALARDVPDDAPPHVEEVIAAPPAARPLTFFLRLEPQRIDAMVRLLRGAVMPGLVSHLFSLRVLFPDGPAHDDPTLAEALALERDALRSVFDRLYVKLRIPGFDACAAECEDSTARRSIAVLLEAAEQSSDAGGTWTDGPVLTATVRRSEIDELRDAVAAAPLGAPAALDAVAAFLPSGAGSSAALDDALKRYVGGLRTMLRRYALLDPTAFERALVYGDDPELDTARDALVAALVESLALVAS